MTKLVDSLYYNRVCGGIGIRVRFRDVWAHALESSNLSIPTSQITRYNLKFHESYPSAGVSPLAHSLH